MSVTNDLKTHFKVFAERDRRAAVEALAEVLYREILPRASGGGSRVVFSSAAAMAQDCEAHGLDVRAMRRVLAEMEEEKLLASDGGDFRLTDRGIESLSSCV